MKNIEIAVFNDKSWVRLIEYQKNEKQLTKRICELQSDLSRAKNQIGKMKCCQNCCWFLLRLEDEIYKPYCCKNDKYLQIEKVCTKWSLEE